MSSATAQQPSLVVDLKTVPEGSTVPAVVAPESEMARMIERLASNPDVNVDKLERLIAMQERVLDRNAEAAFNVAFAEMQPKIPEITERGAIKNKEGGVQSRYAKNEDIQKVIRPILKAHGFTLSFRTEWPGPKLVKVVGILTHNEGHARTSEFQTAADESGSKNAIQGLGSAVSYGHRYTTIDLLNITSRGQDDDGEKTDRINLPAGPEGYAAWLEDMEATADTGSDKLQAAWDASPIPFRKHLTKTDPKGWAKIKTRAEGVR
jgi:hypothetical protein